MRAGGQGRAPRSGGPTQPERPPPTPCWPADVSGYSPSLREALVPLVADHKCSSPEVYGADISPNMLCAGYFDCRSDACQVSLGSPLPRSSEPRAARPSGPARRWGGRPTSQSLAAPRMGAHPCRVPKPGHIEPRAGMSI